MHARKPVDHNALLETFSTSPNDDDSLDHPLRTGRWPRTFHPAIMTNSTDQAQALLGVVARLIPIVRIPLHRGRLNYDLGN